MENLKINYEETREGVPTIKCNDYYLHSKYAPLKEAKRLANEYYKPHHLHVVFGFGAGYLIDALIEEFKFNEPILLLDPLADAGYIKYKNNKKYDRLFYVNMNSQHAMEIIANNLSSFTTQITFIASNNYNHIVPKELKMMAEFTRDTQNKQLTNINTSAYFALAWQINYALNLSSVQNDVSLNVLHKKYDLPVVVASGGPSLTKQLELVKKYREKIILICAGSTINSLLRANIMPDYVVSIDGGEDNYNHFKDLYLEDTTLIYSPIMHHGIRKTFKRKSLVMVPHVRPTIARHLESYFGQKYPIINGGGSVAHFALSIAKYITTGPICLIGQDLAYTNNLTHAEGNKHSKEQLEHTTEIEGYNGDIVYTDSKFKIMINTFNEFQVLDKHENEVFNCTEGGAKLVEYPQIPFKHFLNEYTLEDIVIYNKYSNDSLKRTNGFSWRQEKIIYDKILKLLFEGISLVKGNKTALLSPKVVKKIGEIEKQLNILYEKTCLDMLLEPNVVFAEHQFLPKVNETKQEELDRAKEYIINLYSSCTDSIKKYIESVETILKEQ